MFFTVLSVGQWVPNGARMMAFLRPDSWDDWFTFNTLYKLFICDEEGEIHIVGGVKIGQFNMASGQNRPDIPQQFESLSDEFFSLGQDDSYYERLTNISPQVRDRVLRGLRDVALDRELFQRVLGEKVTGVSLLRSVTKSTVIGQFHRLARGGARLSKYEFEYTAAKAGRSKADPVSLKFSVEPGSMPPTNIHVLIGRNGVGKTHILNQMTRCLVDKRADPKDVGSFLIFDEDELEDNGFASLVSVTFSAFDPFEPLPNRQDKSKGMPYSYVGLKRTGLSENGKRLAPKSPDKLSVEFGNSVLVCSNSSRQSRWQRALEMLETDSIFREAEVAALADENIEDDEKKERAKKLFGNLSSGHKIVLLTITRLVELVEERTLVLLDEPEAHLHPPLLSAFIRSLSDLLINRNGVAIIATHSPVILQEVPASCVWKIRRSGRIVDAERPEIETFGENVGLLTREIFGLEVTHSGFNRLLKENIGEREDFDEVVDKFDSELGGEARAILRAFIAERDREET